MAPEDGSTSVAPAAPATPPAAPAADAPSIVVPDGPVTVLEEKSDITDTRESLFGDETRFSEAELTGEEAGDGAAPAAATPPAQPGAKEAVTPPPAGDAGKEVQTPEQEAAARAAEDAGKDPVVRATEGIRRELTEERQARRTLAQQLEVAQQTISQLQGEIQRGVTAPQASPMDKFKDFKELSDDEYDDLVTTDYAEAQRYIKRLADYREAQHTAAEQDRQQRSISEAAHRNAATIINTSREAMAQEVPGLYDEKSDINERLMTFAEQHGMDGDLLAALTDPATVIVQRGAKSGAYLGRGAVATLRLLHNLYQGEARIRDELTRSITEQVMGKVKTDAGVYKSLGDNPAQTIIPEDTGQIVTEDDFRNLSEADQRRLLGG